jgi:hypothetical protein
VAGGSSAGVVRAVDAAASGVIQRVFSGQMNVGFVDDPLDTTNGREVNVMLSTLKTRALVTAVTTLGSLLWLILETAPRMY